MGIIAMTGPKTSPNDLSLSFTKGGKGDEAKLQTESLFSNLTAVLQHELVCQQVFGEFYVILRYLFLEGF
jgi:hypothetical protein